MTEPTRPPQGSLLQALESLRLDNRALRDLPVRQSDGNPDETALTLASGACYVLLRSPPPPLPRLHLLASSPAALALLGLDPTDAERRPSLYLSTLLGAGSSFLPGTQASAHVYSGHQFGFFAGLLGDGAALYLGEVAVAAGAGPSPPQRRRLELNLEGAGPTPLTRQGRGNNNDNDSPQPGRKTLLQATREFLTSEALAALDVPTTRSCLLAYCPESRCATVLRVAPSFLRIGSLEVCRGASAATGRAGPSAPLSLAAAAAASSSSGPQELLPRVLDHAIRRHYPEVWRAFGGGEDDEQARQDQTAAAATAAPSFPPAPFHLASDPETRSDMAAAFLGELSAAHGRTTALWQAQGFLHGCLNSDNLSLSGETINAGNCSLFFSGGSGRGDGDADDSERPFDRAFSPHPLDFWGGYSLGSQPGAVRFALERLAEALGSASAMVAAGIAGVAGGAAAEGAGAGAASAPPPQHAPLAMPGGIGPGRARRELARFDAEFDRVYLDTMRRKLGLLLVADDGGLGGEEAAAADEGEGGATGDRALVSALLAVMQATGADYAKTMRRLRMVPMLLRDEDDDDDAFGGFLSPAFLREELPRPSALARRAVASLPPEANVRALAALARRDAAFAHALGVPREALERVLERFKVCEALQKMGEAEKRQDDARRWRLWLRRYRRRLQREAEAACVGLTDLNQRQEALRGAIEARRSAMDGSNPAVVLAEGQLRSAVAAAEGGEGDGGAAIRRLLERLRRPFDED